MNIGNSVVKASGGGERVGWRSAKVGGGGWRIGDICNSVSTKEGRTTVFMHLLILCSLQHLSPLTYRYSLFFCYPSSPLERHPCYIVFIFFQLHGPSIAQGLCTDIPPVWTLSLMYTPT